MAPGKVMRNGRLMTTRWRMQTEHSRPDPISQRYKRYNDPFVLLYPHHALYALPAIMVECFARMAEGETDYGDNVDPTQHHRGKEPWHTTLEARLRDALEQR